MGFEVISYLIYVNSSFVFQEGGKGRGNGMNFIHQWQPEYHPEKVADNLKIYSKVAFIIIILKLSTKTSLLLLFKRYDLKVQFRE